MSDEHEPTKEYVDWCLGTIGPQGTTGISGCPNGPTGAVGPESEHFEEPVPFTGGSIMGELSANAMFSFGPVHVTPGDPVDIQIDQGVDYTGAAKIFLNEVFKLMGKPSPFAW